MARAVRSTRGVKHGLLLVGLAVGCSSSNTHTSPKDPKDAERSAAQTRRDALDAEKPASPYETRRQLAFKPTERCGQGPYRLEADAVGTPYAEEVIVYACGAHAISGNYRLTVQRPKGGGRTDESAFGFDRDNAACKDARQVTTVVAGGSGSGTGTGAAGTGGGGKGARKTAPAVDTIAPTKLERVATVPTTCERRTQLLDHTWLRVDDAPGLEVGTRLVIDVWSEEPNDLDGLTFVIETRGVSADMTIDKWKAYGAAMDDWHDRYTALLDAEVAAGRTTLIDRKVKTPPPPAKRAETPPPRPSRNARWIPGYWHYDAKQFHWIAGLWDVPQEDIEKDLTVHAPKPPPPAPVEEKREPQPTATATWTPGQWQWDGRAYVWVTGAWRIPPAPDQTWKPAGWRVKVGGAVYVPGGWTLRVRRR